MKTIIKLTNRFFLLSLLVTSCWADLTYAGQGLGGDEKGLGDEKNEEFIRHVDKYKQEMQGKLRLCLKRPIYCVGLSSRRFLEDDDLEALADALIANEGLISLSLEGRRIHDKGAAYLGAALETNNTLKKIYLRRSKITGKGAAVLLSSRNLELISLIENDIKEGDEISEALLNNNTLRSLDLSSNSLSIRALEKIIEAAKTKQNLVDLNLADTVPASAEGIRALFSIPKLISLSLTIDPTNPTAMAALMSALESDMKLKVLSIHIPNHSMFSEDNFHDTFNALRENRCLILMNIKKPNGSRNRANLLSDENLKAVQELAKKNNSPEGEKLCAWERIKYFAPPLFGMGNTIFDMLLPELKKKIILDLVDAIVASRLMDFKTSSYAEYLDK